ncbi:MAG: hypothetical protein Rsou_1334 [Candidatus Ruthia sp. Asou_11_S2]|nr:hypothetical protein [Candidatus Ruthia sp. Asou_11_S2]
MGGHWVNGKVVGKAGGQTAKVATQVPDYSNDNLYKLENGEEKGVFYIHQIKLCRTADGAKHCSVSDPLKLYVVASNGVITKTKITPVAPKDENDNDIEVPGPVETYGGTGDSGEEGDDIVPPGQTKDTSISINTDSQNTKGQTPLATPSIGYIAGSWKAFATSSDIAVKLNKYYGNVGSHWKIETYK